MISGTEFLLFCFFRSQLLGGITGWPRWPCLLSLRTKSVLCALLNKLHINWAAACPFNKKSSSSQYLSWEMQVNLWCYQNRDFSCLYNCTFCISDFFNLTVTSFCVVFFSSFFFFRVLRNIFLFRCSGGLIAALNPARCRHCKLAWGEEARRTAACGGRAGELFQHHFYI